MAAVPDARAAVARPLRLRAVLAGSARLRLDLRKRRSLLQMRALAPVLSSAPLATCLRLRSRYDASMGGLKRDQRPRWLMMLALIWQARKVLETIEKRVYGFSIMPAIYTNLGNRTDAFLRSAEQGF